MPHLIVRLLGLCLGTALLATATAHSAGSVSATRSATLGGTDPSDASSSSSRALGLPDCPDDDGDGFQDCAGGSMCNPTDTCGDCDDHDASVSPSAAESCNGTDDDCDGLVDDGFGDADADTRADCIDCDPFDVSTWELPQQTDSLRLKGPAELSWNHIPQGTIAHLYRGRRGPGAPFGYNHACLASGLSAGSFVDDDSPVTGELYYYLVEGANSCGDGGFAPGTNAERPNDTPCVYVPRDSDMDGLGNIDDNCPLIANSEQVDVDLDGVGDACDTCSSVFNPSQQPACSDNGVCVASDEVGDTRCACDPGYVGETCEDLHPSVVTEFVGLPEPDAWLVDSGTGLRYRRATRDERLRFHWFPGTYLVEAPGVGPAVGRGEGTVELVLPTGDDTTRTVFLDLVHSDTSGGQIIEVMSEEAVARVNVTTPTFHDYLSRAPDGTPFGELLYLSAVEDGGSVFRGTAGDYEIDGYTPIRSLQLDAAIAEPNDLDPGAVVPMTLLQPSGRAAGAWNDCHGEGICDAYCTNMGLDTPCDVDDSVNPCCQPFDPDGGPADDCHDNFDNDSDGQIDVDGDPIGGGPADGSCLHSEYCVGGGLPAHSHDFEAGMQFMLLGDVNYCTYLVKVKAFDWKAKLHDRAVNMVNNGFEEPTGYAPYDALAALGTPMVMRWVALKCWILDNLEQARDCKNGDLTDCGPFQVGHVYPYAGAGNNASSYLQDATDWMDDPPRKDLAHSIAVGLANPVNFAQVVMATDQGTDLTGVLSPSVGGLNVGIFSVVKASDTYQGEHWSYGVHELGHAFGLTHCDAETSPVDNECTVMGDSNHTGGGFCSLATICDAPAGKSRFGPGSAQILYGGVRGTAFPYNFGNIPPPPP